MADPGFPRRGGANRQGGSVNLLFGQISPQNCMNMKEIGPRGGGRASLEPPLDPPMYNIAEKQHTLVFTPKNYLDFSLVKRVQFDEKKLYGSHTKAIFLCQEKQVAIDRSVFCQTCTSNSTFQVQVKVMISSRNLLVLLEIY